MKLLNSFTSKTKPLPLFWWSERKFSSRSRENYGDLLSKYLVEKISGKTVKWIQPQKQTWYRWNRQHFISIGSILQHATTASVVWGSGIIDQQQHIEPATFHAVRGPQTRKYLLKLGYNCPKVYGDPALLLPLYYKPSVEKRFRTGIIPHYVDFPIAKTLFAENEETKIIDLLTLDVEAVTREILSCEKIISSSLHGVIVAQSYGIPAIWIQFSKKLAGSGIKYRDYFESVEIESYIGETIRSTFRPVDIPYLFKQNESLPKKSRIEELRRGLLSSCPFGEHFQDH